jgi:signal transduction histidine kinase
VNGESIRVLVVDDELGMREGCRKVLAPEGYSVETAADGVAGLELFKDRGDFAIVLVDLNMPLMGGMELIDHLRKLDEDVVIFVITAYAAIDTAVEATRKGAYGYIPKPFTPDELLLPIRQGLERRALTIEARRLREERESRLLEVALERSKSSTIIGCMTDGVLVINRDRQMVLRNAAMTRMMPRCAGLPLSAPMNTLKCPELESLIEETLCTDSGPVIASRELALDKSTYMVNASPVLEPNGLVTGAVVVLRDITALKKLDIAKSMFISMVAHELKSPLAAVVSQLSLILDGTVSGDAQKERHILDRCLLRIDALRTMVSDLLSLTAMETGRFTIKRSALNISEVVSAVLDSYKEKAQDKHITLEMARAPDADKVRVLADRESMMMVFANLVDNAIKYTPDGGQVYLSVECNGVFLKVSVRDTGIGMTAEEKERVFDEFYRVKNEYAVHVPGTGLGLSLVKKLVEMHQGHVSVQSVPGKGSTFCVNLPLTG